MTPIPRLALQHTILVIQSVLDGNWPYDQGDNFLIDEYQVTARALHIRTGAGVQFPNLGYLIEGDRITPDKMLAGWMRFDFGSVKGWVNSNYLVEV